MSNRSRRGSSAKAPARRPGPPPTTQEAASGLQALHYQESYSSPFPHPEHLKQYDALVPGTAAMIFAEVHAQSEHRRELEQATVAGVERRAYRGQVIGATLFALAILGGILTVLLGQPVAGATIVSAALASGALVYIIGGRPGPSGK